MFDSSQSTSEPSPPARQVGFAFWEPPASRPKREPKAARKLKPKPAARRSKCAALQQAPQQAPQQPQPASSRPKDGRPISTLNAIEALIARCQQFESTAAEDAPGWNPNIVAMFHLREAHEAMKAFQFEQQLNGCGDSNTHKP